MPSCGIYIFTYKRNHLLQRAIKSLLDQTFTDWVCELHNDCPEDDFPGNYVYSLNDDRFTLHHHLQNLGAVKSFNYAFAGCQEEYASMLEDDNWWEPTFLEEMISLMKNAPTIRVAWRNIKLWQEKEDGNWEDTGTTTWPVNKDPFLSRFSWPQLQQAIGALHSTSALLYRGLCAHYKVPDGTLLNAIELIRERSFEHPICLVHKPLANFAITKATNRSADPLVWIGSQLMLLASFIVTSPSPEKVFRESLAYHRGQRPTPVANFFLANMLLIKNRAYYRLFQPGDWLFICKWLIKNGLKLNRLKQYLIAQEAVYEFLLSNTSNRYKESEGMSP